MRQFGVRSFDMDINTGSAVLLPAEDKPLPFTELQRGVRKAGFELLSLELEVRGNLQPVKDTSGAEWTGIRADGTGQEFRLAEDDSEEGFEVWDRLESLLDEGDVHVSIRGRVSLGASSSGELQVEALDVVER